jgi:hypothetical protein
VATGVELRFKNRATTCRAMVLPGISEPLLGAIPLEDMPACRMPTVMYEGLTADIWKLKAFRQGRIDKPTTARTYCKPRTPLFCANEVELRKNYRRTYFSSHSNLFLHENII